MANTQTNMQALIFSQAAIRKFNAIMSPLSALVFDASPAPAQLGNVVRIPTFPTSTSADAFAGSYAGVDRTFTGVDVTLNQHVFDSFAFTDRELVESPAKYFENMGAQIGKSVAKKVLQTVMAVVTATNYGDADGDKMTIAPSAIKPVDFTTLRKLLFAKGIQAMDAAVVIGGDYFSTLLGDTILTAQMYGGTEAIRGGKIPSLFGFEGIYESAVIPDNSENLGGFACAKQAIAFASRALPPQSTAAMIDAGQVTEEQSGLTLGYRVIPEPLAGKVHFAIESLFGYAKLDGAALVRIKSA